MNKDDIKNISNIQVSKECYKKIKIKSIEDEKTIQEVIQIILEDLMGKKGK